jgi:radical SAM superfamily enzyme YgiQ (UPF0313 family)
LLAPYGTRKIEAALLDYGFSEDQVIVAPPEHLHRVIGPDTRVVGITTTDPLGKGPASSTFSGSTGFVTEESYNAWKFRELLTNPILRKWGAKVVVGGAGAWQLEEEPEVAEKLGIDVLLVGEGDVEVGPLFKRIIDGESVPKVVYGSTVDVDEMPIIRRPSIGGIVEVARGCGRGCKFCIPTLQKLRCRPIPDIIEEAEVNVKHGQNCITLHAEDVLRYNARGFRPNCKDVIRLFQDVKSLPGAENVGMSHFSLSSAVSNPKLIEDLSELVEAGDHHSQMFSGQTGLETGSPRMIEKHMPGKVKPFKPEEWPEVARQAFGICHDNHLVPCATLVLGLPGEEAKDVDLTTELVEDLSSCESLIVPLFFVASGSLEGERTFTAKDLTHSHYELLKACWDHNLRWLMWLKDHYVRRAPIVLKAFLAFFANWLRIITDKKVKKALARHRALKSFKLSA